MGRSAVCCTQSARLIYFSTYLDLLQSKAGHHSFNATWPAIAALSDANAIASERSAVRAHRASDAGPRNESHSRLLSRSGRALTELHMPSLRGCKDLKK